MFGAGENSQKRGAQAGSEDEHGLTTVAAVGSLARLNYADLIIDYLAQIGVEYVFGIQGGAVEPLFNAVARRRSVGGFVDQSVGGEAEARHRETLLFGPTPVFPRHEASAAFMADGYYRETGRMAVCCATTGPGATNLITGVASAYADNIPMLVLTPQAPISDFGRGPFQDSSYDAIDVTGMFQHCTRYNSIVTDAEQLERKLITAIITAHQHPRGPVHLSIPTSIMKEAPPSDHQLYNIGSQLRDTGTLPSRGMEPLLTIIRNAIQAQEKLLFVVGGSAEVRGAQAIQKASELLNAYVVATPPGARWVNAYHPMYKGIFGMAGHPSARASLDDPEIKHIVVVGSLLSETETAGWSPSVLNERMIRIDSGPELFARASMAQLHVHGCIPLICEAIEAAAREEFERFAESNPEKVIKSEPEAIRVDYSALPPQVQHFSEQQFYSDELPIKPQRLMRELAMRCPDDTRYFFDAGNSWNWGLHYLHRQVPGNHRTATTFGSMNWSMSASIGAALGRRTAPVVSLLGDGSWLMGGQELTLALQEKLPIIFVVLNDAALGMVMHGQRMAGAERIGWQHPKTNFAAIAEAMGARGFEISSIEDLDRLNFDYLLNSTTPTVLDVHIDAEEVPPLGERLKVLANKLEG